MANEIKNNNDLVLFENSKIRRTEVNGEWYYSIVDIIAILSESKDPNAYWRKLKQRLSEESNESVTFCHQLKLPSKKDGKKYKTDCANRETIFRIIQSVPSPNAEPFKLWFARLAEEGRDFAILTNEISKTTFGITTEQHKSIKGINQKQNLRDNMSPLELALTTLAEVTTTELHKTNDSKDMKALKNDANIGGSIAGNTRRDIEKQIRKKVVTSENSLDFTGKRQIENK